MLPSTSYTLFNFLVRLVLAARRTEFAELQPFGGGLLVLGLAVVLAFALGALKRDDFSWHFSAPTR
jgi:heme/copper-type cytochrome/quinol oxidase subunit 1